MSTSLQIFEDSMNRLMNEPRSGRQWSPAVDILETEDAVVLKADLPDVSADNIDLRVEHHTLTLRGERQFNTDENSKGFHRIERRYGEFMRSFVVPSTVDTEKVNAGFNNGVLTISLPKKEAAKPRQVKVSIQQPQSG